jgi:hypothetical protein
MALGPRPGVVVVNRSRHPSGDVAAIVRANIRGNPRHPRRVIVHDRERRSDDREGFTPFDPGGHIDLWVEPADRYPQPGARTWRQELAMSAAHEDYHARHPDRACPGNRCEARAESYARRTYRYRSWLRRRR